MRKLFAVGTLGVAVFCLSANSARAEQVAKAGPKGARVFAQPSAYSTVKGRVRAGQAIHVLDQPKDGFYGVAGMYGTSGWVQASEVTILPPPPPKPSSQKAKAPQDLTPARQEPVSSTPAPTPSPSPTPEPKPEEAEAASKVRVGVLGGLGITGGGSSMAFGADVSYKVTRAWTLGVYFQYLGLMPAAQAVAIPGAPVTSVGSSTLLLLAGELNFYVPNARGFYLGGKLGTGIASASATNATLTPATSKDAPSTTSFIFGGAAGFDYPVFPVLSLGCEGNIFQLTSPLDATLVNLLVTAKYFF